MKFCYWNNCSIYLLNPCHHLLFALYQDWALWRQREPNHYWPDLWPIIFEFSKILAISSKIFVFWKILQNSNFRPTSFILCFSGSKNPNKPNILPGGGLCGSKMKFFDISVKKFGKNLQNWWFLQKYGQYPSNDGPMGLQTNSNQLSTQKYMEIEYLMIFLAFSEVKVNYFVPAGHFRPRPNFKRPASTIFFHESNLFLDIMNI